MSSAAEYRQIATMLRAKALAGGGVVQYQFNGKSVRVETVNDMIKAAAECDRMADLIDGVGRAKLSPVRHVWRRG